MDSFWKEFKDRVTKAVASVSNGKPKATACSSLIRLYKEGKWAAVLQKIIDCNFSILGLVGSPNTNKAWVHDPNLWTYPIICVSTHIERQEADVNSQEFVIPFLTASRPLWENNTVREVTA